MEWPQPLSELVTSTETAAARLFPRLGVGLVAASKMASAWFGTLKRRKWAVTIWPPLTWEAGIFMYSTNITSIQEFCKKEMEIQSTSNTNLRYFFLFEFICNHRLTDRSQCPPSIFNLDQKFHGLSYFWDFHVCKRVQNQSQKTSVIGLPKQ